MSYYMETIREVWNERFGDHYEIGLDQEGLDLMELRYKDEKNLLVSSVSFPIEIAEMIAQSIMLCAKERDMNDNKHQSSKGNEQP